MEEILHQLTGSLSHCLQRFTRFYISQVLVWDFFQQSYCIIHVEFTWHGCENLRGNRITTVASETPGLHPSHEERGTKRKQNWKSGIRKWKGCVSNKTGRASPKTSQWLTVVFFLHFTSKQVFLVEFLCEWWLFFGACETFPPKKKRHLQIWHSHRPPCWGPERDLGWEPWIRQDWNFAARNFRELL